MSCSLFNSFDPYVNLSIIGLMQLKWMSGLLVIFLMDWQIYLVKNSVPVFWKKVQQLFISSFSSMIKDLKESYILLFSLLMLIIFINLIGLSPFTFSISSHLSINLSFSLTLWLSGVIISVMNSVNKFMAHMVPTGTPIALWAFLVLVETVSLMIRPFTLAIRLMANVMAGHLVLSLLGTLVSAGFYLSAMLMFQSLFIMFELCISIIQAYVFVSLLSLYWNES